MIALLIGLTAVDFILIIGIDERNHHHIINTSALKIFAKIFALIVNLGITVSIYNIYGESFQSWIFLSLFLLNTIFDVYVLNCLNALYWKVRDGNHNMKSISQVFQSSKKASQSEKSPQNLFSKC